MALLVYSCPIESMYNVYVGAQPSGLRLCHTIMNLQLHKRKSTRMPACTKCRVARPN
jgi:hypothetical protein